MFFYEQKFQKDGVDHADYFTKVLFIIIKYNHADYFNKGEYAYQGSY